MSDIKSTMKNYIEEIMVDYPICEYAFGHPSQIPISDKVYTICETDCERYKKCWACPPHAGTMEDNIKRLNSYENCFVFTTIWEVSDSWNKEACVFAKRQHEEVTRQIRERVFEHFNLTMESLDDNPRPDIHFLSSGCMICEKCACPDEPCKHPQERMMAMESHGVVIVLLAENLGLTIQYDSTTVVYLSMLLW